MTASRSIAALGIVALVLSACSGGGPATQQPAGATQSSGGGTATQGPQATVAGGGGGGGAPDFTYGKAHVEVRGTADRTVDLGFLPIASHFGGQDQTILNYVPGADAPTETFSVTVSGGGTVIVAYASLDLTVTGTECTASNTNFGASSASGTIECSKTAAVTGTGAVDGVTLKATFDAHG